MRKKEKLMRYNIKYIEDALDKLNYLKDMDPDDKTVRRLLRPSLDILEEVRDFIRDTATVRNIH